MTEGKYAKFIRIDSDRRIRAQDGYIGFTDHNDRTAAACLELTSWPEGLSSIPGTPFASSNMLTGTVMSLS